MISTPEYIRKRINKEMGSNPKYSQRQSGYSSRKEFSFTEFFDKDIKGENANPGLWIAPKNMP
jgi:hypothetical protein